MDYKALRQRASAFAHVVEDCGLGAVPFDVDGINIVALPTSDILALCDAVEALEKDANRWRWYAKSPQTALMLGSKLDPNSEQDWVAENGRLADTIMRDAFYQAVEASTPTPAAPSDA